MITEKAMLEQLSVVSCQLSAPGSQFPPETVQKLPKS
jgi:hypothetical protein